MINFDDSPKVYLMLCYSIGWVILALAIWPAKPIGKQTWRAFIHNDLLFLAIALLTLFLLRLPSIVFNQEINIDESQLITQALTLRQDPVYFRSVDGTTGGPLSSYVLILPSFLGLPFDYITARLVTFVLVALSLVALFYAARLAFGQRSARLALIPFVFILGLSQTWDFLIYGSEILSVATLSWLYYLAIAYHKKPVKTPQQLILIGFLCGLVPFEKIQGTLLAAVVGLFVVSQVLSHRNLAPGQKGRQLLLLALGAISFPLLFIAWIYSEGLFEDFVNFYIRDNLSYSQPLTPLQKLIKFQDFLTHSVEFTWLLALLGGVLVVWLFTVTRQHITDATARMIYLFILVLVLAATYTVTFPGTYFIHYLHYLFGPLMLLFAFLLSALHTPLPRLSTTALLAVFMGAFSFRVATTAPLNPFATEKQGGWTMPQNNVTKAIARYAHRGEPLAVWGWHNDYYVRLQMPQAVAENHTIRSIEHKTMKAIYHKRYAANMVRSRPPVFVDVVGKQGYYLTNRKTQGYEINAALRQFIAQHYTYIGMTDDVRMFVRNDRFKAIAVGQTRSEGPANY